MNNQIIFISLLAYYTIYNTKKEPSAIADDDSIRLF